jgi:hypothetical protein
VHLAHHLPGGDNLLAGEVTAPLRRHLVLDLDRGRPCAFKPAHRAGHGDRVPEAGVRIDDQGEVHHVGDRGDLITQLGQPCEADVRNAEV